MKKLFALVAVLFSLTVMAEETMTLRYSCQMNKSDILNVYEINLPDFRVDISIQIDNFHFGVKEVVGLINPFIVDYGGVYMITQDFGRSGYFFMRFENGKKAYSNDYGNSWGRIDDNRFLGYANPSGFKKGALSSLANCSTNKFEW